MRWIYIEDSTLVHFIEAMVKVVNLWSWILVLFGYAAKFLNKKSELLSYANRAVYPFYILHQTITIITAYFLMNLDWGFGLKIGMVLVGTFDGRWIIYDLVIVKTPIIHPLSGLNKAYSSGANSSRSPASSGEI